MRRGGHEGKGRVLSEEYHRVSFVYRRMLRDVGRQKELLVVGGQIETRRDGVVETREVMAETKRRANVSARRPSTLLMPRRLTAFSAETPCMSESRCTAASFSPYSALSTTRRLLSFFVLERSVHCFQGEQAS